MSDLLQNLSFEQASLHGRYQDANVSHTEGRTNSDTSKLEYDIWVCGGEVHIDDVSSTSE